MLRHATHHHSITLHEISCQNILYQFFFLPHLEGSSPFRPTKKVEEKGKSFLKERKKGKSMETRWRKGGHTHDCERCRTEPVTDPDTSYRHYFCVVKGPKNCLYQSHCFTDLTTSHCFMFLYLIPTRGDAVYRGPE
jgi:hypothetical protein